MAWSCSPPPGRVPTSCPQCIDGRYTVVAGDSMFSIAQRFGIPLSLLVCANPQIPNPNVLFPGDVLCVPPTPLGREPESCPRCLDGLYVVMAGDSMFSIAQRFGIPTSLLICANPQITNPNQLFPGDVLCVPNT